MLSSTTPLLQAWYVRANKTGIPWRLFALSNAASLAALLRSTLTPLTAEQDETTLIEAVLGVTESRICQLHSQSIARLRVKLREW